MTNYSISDYHKRFDAITIDDLREWGNSKWSRFPNLLGCFIAELDFGTTESIQQTIRDYADSNSFGYMTGPWPEQVAEATADFMRKRFSWDIDPELIEIVPDVISGLEIALEIFSEPDSKAILPTPAYYNFFPSIEGLNREVIEVPMTIEDNWALPLKGIEEALKKGARDVILCNPQNPTGRIYDKKELQELAVLVDKYGARVFNDEIHSPISLGKEHIPYPLVSDLAKSHSVTATSPSKAWNIPGMRCAQVIFNNKEELQKYKTHPLSKYLHRTSNLGAFANIAAYREDGPWLEAVNSYIKKNVDYLEDFIEQGKLPGIENGVHWVRPEATFLVWIDFSNTKAMETGPSPAKFLEDKAGVKVTSGASCGQGWDSWARLNIGTPHHIWKDILDNISKAL